MARQLHEPEDMDAFEKGWSLLEDTCPQAKAAGQQNVLHGLSDSMKESPKNAGAGGFLPSIAVGGSASARVAGVQVRLHSLPGNDSPVACAWPAC
jgi:hypothetical protein